MDPYEFERLVAKIWEKQGWETQVTQGSTDKGVDILANKEDAFEKRRHLIQVKRHGENTKVSSEEIQRYAGLYTRDEKVDNVFVVTSNQFTEEARKIADNRNVQRVESDELIEKIFDFGLEDQLLGTGEDKQTKSSVSDEDQKLSEGHPFDSNKIPDNASPTPTQNLLDICPECGKTNTIWFTKRNNRRLLKCEVCLSGWEESTVESTSKKGILESIFGIKSSNSKSNSEAKWTEYKGPNQGETKSLRNWSTQ